MSVISHSYTQNTGNYQSNINILFLLQTVYAVSLGHACALDMPTRVRIVVSDGSVKISFQWLGTLQAFEGRRLEYV